MSIYLGIDSGTQSTKCIALDLIAGRIVAEARVSHGLISGLPSGHMEQQPEVWAEAMDKTVQRVLRKIDREKVRALGVSGQQHGFVPLDRDGAVIRPAKLWCDTSTTAECAHLTARLGGGTFRDENDRPSNSTRIHSLKDSLAQEARTNKLQETASCTPPARLP